MKFGDLRSCLAVLICGFGMIPAKSHAAVLYSSVPDLAAAPLSSSVCSSCSGWYEPVDKFTLTSDVTITGFNLVTWNGYSGSYSGLTGFKFQIFDSALSTLLYSSPTTSVSSLGAMGPDTIEVSATIAPLNLAAGTYWAGFFGSNMAVALVPGGNNSNVLLDRPGDPAAGINDYYAGNTAYELLGSVQSAVPEPSTWAMMILGFVVMGFATHRRGNRLRRIA